jgi:hypothetical protein
MLVRKPLLRQGNRERFATCCFATALTAIGGVVAMTPPARGEASAIPQDPSRLLVVDCLLPGQVRKLGGQMTYLSPRRAVKTTAVDCEIRGGEYVAYDRANYATALQVWMPQAEGGDAQAQVYVGEIFEKGLGRPADYAEAAKWYQKAAAQNFARAQMNLAYFYEQGLGVEKDPLKALNLYRQASGITDDSLAYASEVTEVRSEMQRTIDDLTDQLEARNTEVVKLKADLDASQSSLSAQRSALARAQGEARGLQEQVAQLRSQAPSDPARVAELKRMERELQAREQRLLQEESAVASLEADTASMRARLAEQMRDAAEKDLALRSELEQATQARDELQQKLVQTQRQLLDTEQQASRLRAKLTSEQAKIAADRQALARQAPQPSPGAVDEQRRRMAAELTAREKSLAQQQAQIAALLEQQRSYTAELTRLRSELAARGRGEGQSQAQVAATRSELAATQRKLGDTEQEVAQLKAQLEAERTKAAADRQQLANQSTATSTEAQRQRQQMTSELAARERRIAEQQTRIAALEQQQRAYNAELARLRASPPNAGQVKQQQAQLASTRTELASTQRRLVETEQRVADLTAQLDAERRSISTEREQINRRAATASGAQQAEIERLRKALAVREAELNKQQALIASLQAESKAYQQQVQRLQSLPVERVAMRGAGESGKVAVPAGRVPKELRIGNYYALVIGNNRYEHMPNLESAVPDAQAVDEVLRTRYGFRTRVLLNATRSQILSALNDYRGMLRSDDSLLVYYAGHGDLDTQNLRGYWLPVNAQRDDNTEWISDQQITSQIETMSARHVLVVADSCYSGAMTRSNGVSLLTSGSTDAEIKRLTKLAKLPSRTVLTSGGEQPVLDAGGGGHSIFARAFLQVLRSNDKVLEGSSLYNQLFDEVRRSAARYKLEQSPRYSALADAGHLNGEFLFIPAA